MASFQLYSKAAKTMNWRDQAGRIYAIVDASCFSSSQLLFDAANELAIAGLKVIQYRNKSGDARSMLAQAKTLQGRIVRTFAWQRSSTVFMSARTIFRRRVPGRLSALNAGWECPRIILSRWPKLIEPLPTTSRSAQFSQLQAKPILIRQLGCLAYDEPESSRRNRW